MFVKSPYLTLPLDVVIWSSPRLETNQRGWGVAVRTRCSIMSTQIIQRPNSHPPRYDAMEIRHDCGGRPANRCRLICVLTLVQRCALPRSIAICRSRPGGGRRSLPRPTTEWFLTAKFRKCSEFGSVLVKSGSVLACFRAQWPVLETAVPVGSLATGLRWSRNVHFSLESDYFAASH